MIALNSHSEGGKVTLETSEGEVFTSGDLTQLLNWTWTLYQLRDRGFLVAWDLNAFVTPFVALFPLEKRAELTRTKSCGICGFSVFYEPDRVFSIKRGKTGVEVYHLGQFCLEDEPEPEGLEAVAKWGDALISELESVGLAPSKLTSPAGVAIPILENLDLPNWEDTPGEVGQLAWECVGAAWTECHRIGAFPETFDNDMRSAYGSVMAELLDFRFGDWIDSKEIPEGAVYGFARGRVTITSKVSPIAFTDWRGFLFHPRGSWNETLTLGQIRLIREYGLGSFKVSEGHWWVPIFRVKKLEPVINRLFELRKKSRKLNMMAKGAIVSISGLMTGTNADKSLRPFTNPVWGAVIETETQCKVARFIFDNHLENDLILVSTDGCLTTKKVSVGVGDKIGEWRLDSSGPALAVGSSEVWYSDKRPNQLTYSQAYDLAKKKPRANEWHTRIERRVAVGDLSQGDYQEGQVSQVIDTGFSLKYEHSRNFPTLPSNGKQLLERIYESEPIEAKALRGSRIKI